MELENARDKDRNYGRKIIFARHSNKLSREEFSKEQNVVHRLGIVESHTGDGLWKGEHDLGILHNQQSVGGPTFVRAENARS
jgi:hypothetical protein